MDLALLLCLWVIQGTIACYLAKKKGRNPYLWFAIGCFFGLFGIAIILFLKRIGPAVDKVPLVVAPTSQKPTEQEEPSPPLRLWYYLDEQSTQHGPMSSAALESAHREGKVTASTYVWHEGLPEWTFFEKTRPIPEITQ